MGFEEGEIYGYKKRINVNFTNVTARTRSEVENAFAQVESLKVEKHRGGRHDG